LRATGSPQVLYFYNSRASAVSFIQQMPIFIQVTKYIPSGFNRLHGRNH